MQKALRHHIAAFIDWYGWGFRDKYATDWEVNPCYVLNAFRAKEKGVFPQKLTYKVIEDYHLSDKFHRQGTLYYRSRYHADYAVLMMDLDDKNRTAKDTDAAWNYLRDRYFPGAYGEPSTSGSGTHGFLIIDRQGIEPDAFLDLARRLEQAIGHVIRVRDYRCTFDQLCGIPNKCVNGLITSCSQLGKFPRLNTHAKLNAYLQSPVFKCAEIELIIENMMRCCPSEDMGYLDRLWNNQPIPGEAGDGQESHRSVEGANTSPLYVYITGNSVHGEDGVGVEMAGKGDVLDGDAPLYVYITGNNVPTGQYEGSSERRMGRCAWNLAVKIKRIPSADEIVHEYELLGLHTGSDHDGNRRRLAEGCHAWLAQHFDVSRMEGFSVGKYLPLIHTHVTADIRQNLRQSHRSHYTDDELAVVLYTVEKAAFGNNGRLAPFVCSNGQIEGMFRSLNMEVPNRRQLAVMKKALVQAELIIIVDANFHEGLAKKFGLGPNHPLYHHQADLPERIVPETFAAPLNST